MKYSLESTEQRYNPTKDHQMVTGTKISSAQLNNVLQDLYQILIRLRKEFHEE